MFNRFDISPQRRHGVTMTSFRAALALSLLLHILLMWQWMPQMRLNLSEKSGRDSGPLTVQIEPPPTPPPRAAPAPPGTAAPRANPPAPRPPAVRTPPPAPPVIALNKPAPYPSIPVPSPKTEPAPAPRPQAEGDFAAMLEARRRARGESTPSESPTESENARASRLAAANLNLNNTRQQAFGYDPNKGGGVFQITRRSYDYAEFMFFGWNKDVRRNTSQLIEVRKGNNATIQLAVVRKMIQIIRDYEQDDFFWESSRLGRTIRLSARQRDNAGLEDFMMREFFDDMRLAQ